VAAMHDASFENIIIDGSPRPDGLPDAPGIKFRSHANPDFESQVAKLLGELRKTWTGWAVLRALYDHRKNKNGEYQEVRIVPVTAKEHYYHHAAAFTAPNDRRAASSPSARYMGGLDDPKTPRDDRFDRLGYKGTGVGSGCAVHFDPRGANNDVLLLHELVHAVRQMSGVMDRVPTEFALRGYDDEEEFYSDVVTNIYLSERGEDDQIQFGHYNPDVSAKSLDEFLNDPDLPPMLGGRWPLTPAGLLNHPDLGMPVRRLLFKMKSDNYSMCHDIAYKVRVTVKWNLLYEYMDNPAKYPMY